MIVVDASAIVEFVLGTGRSDRVAEAMASGGLMFAPSHVQVEVASALRRLERSGTLDAPEARGCMSSLERLPIEAIDGQRLVATSWAHRERFHIADSFYVACSLLLEAPLLTCDGRLARAADRLIRVNHIAS